MQNLLYRLFIYQRSYGRFCAVRKLIGIDQSNTFKLKLGNFFFLNQIKNTSMLLMNHALIFIQMINDGMISFRVIMI